MMRRPALLGMFCLAISACAPLTDRVLLLPAPDGRTGAVALSAAAGEIVLAEPYADAAVTATRLRRTTADAQTVRNDYGRLLAMQPARPRVFVVHFELGQDVLTPASQAVLSVLRAELAALPAGEVVVVGHTDRVGSVDANDALSIRRAELVRDLLVAAGVDRHAVSVAGRGEREPAVATADEVPEPRNRRVDIKLR